MPGRVLAVRPPRTVPSPNDAAAALFTDQASARQQPPFGVLIAHPYQVVAEGLGVMLDAQDDLAVLGVAHDGHQAVELAAKHEPTVLLLDAHMPGPDLATTLRAVRAASPATKVMMLSADTRRETIAEALAAGADGFLTKDASSRQVAGAIRKLACGKGSIVTAAEPVSRPARDPSVDLRVRTLSSREREILGLLANGWSNRRIAEECFLSLNTVRTHVRDVLVKLGCTPSWRQLSSRSNKAWCHPRQTRLSMTLMPSRSQQPQQRKMAPMPANLTGPTGRL